MIQIDDKSKCSGCGACQTVCPMHCITMEPDSEGFVYPEVDETACINCGVCEQVCPSGKEKVKPEISVAFAARSNMEDIRAASSSGGVFSVLAEWVIDQGGVVYGCAMSHDQREAVHIRVTDIDNMGRLRGSKYIQSRTEGIYFQVQDDLNNGRAVLFSGTPCQILGLRAFLNKTYQKLLCVDTVCHGVPSVKIWNHYLDYLENKYQAVVRKVNFRFKEGTSRNTPEDEKRNDGQSILVCHNVNDDPYMSLFLRNYSLRPSCYQCFSKGGQSGADITLGDFWGIESVCSEFDDSKGISLVLIHTEKGRSAFAQCKEKIHMSDVDYEKAVEGNPSFYHSVERPGARDAFYQDVDCLNFQKIKKKYLHVALVKRVKRSLIRFLVAMRQKSSHCKRFTYNIRVLLSRDNQDYPV